MKRKLGFVLALVAALVAVVMMAGVLAYRNPLPEGQPGPQAEDLARRLQRFTGHEGWRRTGAVAWSMFGHHLLWDRARGFVRVRWRANTVLFRTSDRAGMALDGEQVLSGDAAASRIEAAYALWINDSFWLDPTTSVFHDGVRRRAVTDGLRQPGLLVHHSTGGVTPGDTYLFLFDERGEPVAFRMWVQVLPIPGVEACLEGWETLSTGVKIATRHRVGPMEWSIEGLKAGETLLDITDDDPFAGLARSLARPASQPGGADAPEAAARVPGTTRTSTAR